MNAKMGMKGTVCTAALVGVLGMSGCVVAVGNDGGSWHGAKPEVSRAKLTALVEAQRAIELGQSKSAVLDDTALGGYASKFAGQSFDGHLVEEWRVQARHERRSFERWYYFVDGELRAFGDDRVELSGRQVGQWLDG